jgi:CheY-like chemotaxis protein
MTRVAVIEDNPDNRLLLQALLEDRFELVEFHSGSAAISGLADANVDVALLDISLPDMSGVDVLRSIRADERIQRLPVIALTAHAMRGDREKYLAEGFDDYVTKPIVDEEILLAAIARQLSDG